MKALGLKLKTRKYYKIFLKKFKKIAKICSFHLTFKIEMCHNIYRNDTEKRIGSKKISNISTMIYCYN